MLSFIGIIKKRCLGLRDGEENQSYLFVLTNRWVPWISQWAQCSSKKHELDLPARKWGPGGADSVELSLRAAEPAPSEPSSVRELRSASLPQGTVRFMGEGCVVSGNLGAFLAGNNIWGSSVTSVCYAGLYFYFFCCVTLHLFPQFECVVCVFSSSLVSCLSGERAC